MCSCAEVQVQVRLGFTVSLTSCKETHHLLSSIQRGNYNRDEH